MKKIFYFFVFIVITVSSFAQAKTDSLLYYTRQLETISQRELSNKKSLEQKGHSNLGNIPIPPSQSSYKSVYAEMSFPEGRIYNGVIVRFKLLSATEYEGISIERGRVLYGRAYINPYGRLHASATLFPVSQHPTHVYFDVFDVIDGHLGTIVNPVPGWISSLSGEFKLNDINLGIAKSSVHVKKNADSVYIKIKPSEEFPVILLANYSNTTLGFSQEVTSLLQ